MAHGIGWESLRVGHCDASPRSSVRYMAVWRHSAETGSALSVRPRCIYGGALCVPLLGGTFFFSGFCAILRDGGGYDVGRGCIFVLYPKWTCVTALRVHNRNLRRSGGPGSCTASTGGGASKDRLPGDPQGHTSVGPVAGGCSFGRWAVRPVCRPEGRRR